ncbi:MAG: cobalamin-independent methionine synthase II family protein [Candidatus Dormiibacterota bacterium]
MPDRILTTHTGSLPRPDDVRQALRHRELDEPIDEPALARRLPSATAEIVRAQVECGLDVVNDGEVSKVSYATYVRDRLDGFGGTAESRPMADLAAFPNYARRLQTDLQGARMSLACIGPVRLRDPDAIGRDLTRFQDAVAALPAPPAGTFMTAASPGVICRFFQNQHYATEEDYLWAVAEAMRPEYRAIVGAGLTLQIDAPDLASARNTVFAGRPTEDFRRAAATQIEALNWALDGLPPEQLRMHVCWGNYEGPHHLDVELHEIIDLLLRARPSWLSIEGSNPRHEHEWEVFQSVQLPDGKGVIPGVIDSTTNFVEHPRLVAQRLLRYTNRLGRERVMAGVDCGFATFAGLSGVDPDIAWAKLASLVEGAAIASEVTASGRPRP